jgi:hypothetical protein
MIQLQNEWVSIGFDEQTGCLQSLRIQPAGKELIKPSAGRRNPFRVWKDFQKPYEFNSHRLPPDPSDLAATCLSPAGKGVTATVVVSADQAVLTYDLGDGLTAGLTVKLDGCHSRWSFKLLNTSDSVQMLLPVFPAISGIQIDRRRGRMLAMNQSGFIDKIWGYEGGPYGNSASCSAQFGCLFEDRQCLGFMIEDETFGPKDIRTVKRGIEVRYFPPRALAPGQTIYLPDTVLLLYDGDWRQTATAYGDWFRRTLRPEATPDWVYEIDTYTGAWAEKKGKPNQEGGNLGSAMDTFEDLDNHYLRFPIECYEYAFYCEQSSRDANGPDGKPLGPQPRRHTDGWNSVRQDLGGDESLRRGVRKLHGMGRRITLYIEGLIVPKDSELFEHIPAARDWVLHNADGTNTGPYTKNEWWHMCPGCVEWQDHVADMAARLVRETDVDGIRLDSYSFYFWPCYNPAHHHASPFDHNLWMQQIFAKVAAAVKAVKPDALLSTESPVDYNCIHFNHSLHQAFDPAKIREQLADTAPLQVALPDYKVCQWTGGALAQTLRLSPDGTGRRPGTLFDRLSRNWQNIRPAVSRTYHRGDVSLPNPVASRDDLHCRRIRGSNEDLVFGTRPAVRRSDEKDLRNGLVFLRKGRLTSEVSLLLEYRPACAWLYDLEQQTLAALDYQYDGATLQFATDANWFMAILEKAAGPSPVIMTGPETVHAGQMLEWTITSPALTQPVQAAVEINGLPGFQALAATVPGKLGVTIPVDARPGQYITRLTGAGLRPVVKVVTIEQARPTNF